MIDGASLAAYAAREIGLIIFVVAIVTACVGFGAALAWMISAGTDEHPALSAPRAHHCLLADAVSRASWAYGLAFRPRSDYRSSHEEGRWSRPTGTVLTPPPATN